jgi:putative AdoMet-dependent methyltransferase
MLSQEGFDQWAKDYDKSVLENEEENSYPFAGYQKVLALIEKAVTSSGPRGASVLDLGFGTACLTSRLYQKGYQIYGIDFSKDMLSLAREKMPEAHLYEGNFTLGLPEALKNRPFDFIIGTYSFHHVPPDKRNAFFSCLAAHLAENGQIFIGDLVFSNSQEYEACRRKFLTIWDQDEIYFTADKTARQMQELGLNCTFHPVSFCAGVLAIRRSSTS